MSISDLIVVMKDGKLQQIAKPQEVYDDPANLFVAQFLGTPPINTFDARIEGGKLYIGDAAVMDVALEDQALIAAVRPEGFIPAAEGVFTCACKQIEIMGRDTSVLCEHPAFTGDNFRAIIDAEDISLVANGQIRFDLKASKICLFDKDGQRIRF